MREPSDGGTITASSAVRSDPHPGSGPTLPHSLGCTLANHGANFRRTTTRIALGAECCLLHCIRLEAVCSFSVRLARSQLGDYTKAAVPSPSRDARHRRTQVRRSARRVTSRALCSARGSDAPSTGEWSGVGREGFGGHHARPEPCRTVPCGCWPPQWERRVALGVKLLLLVPCAGRAARPRGGAGAEGVGYGWGSEPRGWQAPEARGCCVLVFRS